MRRSSVGLILSSALLLFATCALAQSNCSPSTNTSNFNGTPIQPGSVIWFNANFTASGIPSGGATINFGPSTITFTDSGGTAYSLQVPSGQVIFDPSVQYSTTTFNNNTFTTTVPLAGSDEIFFDGVGFPVPAGFSGLVHGPVTWQGSFTADNDGITVAWKWSAAVYSIFSSDYNVVAPKPTHTHAALYNNSDHAGTPEGVDPGSGLLFKKFVVGGARGGGGSDWTGSWSSTVGGSVCVNAGPPPQ